MKPYTDEHGGGSAFSETTPQMSFINLDTADTFFSAPSIDISGYDKIIVATSGGKDSLVCLLHLLDLGARKDQLEIWHHLADGNEGSTLMDWLFTKDYLRQIAALFDLPIYFSWLEGGFEGEMLKQNSLSRPHKIETPDGLLTLPRDVRRSKPATRLKFPQMAASLSVRWCSAALKIDVGRRALNNQARFDGKRILFVSGERREESSNRAKYNQLAIHACDRRNGRKALRVDEWRPVLHWSESEVWALLERHRVIAPVPYRIGFSRYSCQCCIFNSARTWATIARYFPDRARTIANYENQFGITISRNKSNVLEIANSALPFEVDDTEALEQALSEVYSLPIQLAKGETWVIPPGAHSKESCGSV